MPAIVRIIILYILSLLTAFGFSSCHEIEQWEDDPRGNFEALWTVVDEHYCFFADKGVDWDEVHDRYAAKISDEMTRSELFDVCAAMLAELRDGHTNLSSPFEVSYYRKWWSDYPQNYDARLVEQYYFNFNYRQVNGMTYGILPQNVGYIYYGSFGVTLGEGNLDYVLNYLASTQGLIINVRDNGGGDLTNVETLVSRFITQETVVGSIQHKTGPGHGDFSEPYPIHYRPAGGSHVLWGKPVVVLCNRSTFSAANNFVSVMKYLPGVTVVGATTGGGSGMPFSSEIPNGWGVRFSACPMYDARGVCTEQGVTPTEGCAIDLDPIQALAGHDTMLDFAVERLTSGSSY